MIKNSFSVLSIVELQHHKSSNSVSTSTHFPFSALLLQPDTSASQCRCGLVGHTVIYPPMLFLAHCLSWFPQSDVGLAERGCSYKIFGWWSPNSEGILPSLSMLGVNNSCCFICSWFFFLVVVFVCFFFSFPKEMHICIL